MKNKPIVHAYFICFNEEEILPHLIKHYSTFCEKITIVDNNSTDNSVSVAKSFDNVDVVTFNSNNEFNDGVQAMVKNQVWKTSVGTADYVIVGDSDEFLYHPNMIDFLIKSKKRNITIFKPNGYHMVADLDYYPNNDDNFLEKIQYGVKTPVLDKMMMFDCNKIKEINYSVGAHACNPVGEVNLYQADGLKMLHYKFLGIKLHLYKQKLRADRLSDFNKKHGFTLYVLMSENEHIEDYNSYFNKRKKVFG
jgi:glycosyltransferase involved in cell wall biosynthesis